MSAIAKVQDFSGSQVQSGATSYALAVPSAVHAGDALVVEVATDSTGTVSVSDTAGNAYTEDYDNSYGTGPSTRELVFSSVGMLPLSAGDAITVSFPTTATASAVAVQEFAGITSVGPRDVTIQASADSKFPASGSSSNTSQANELLIGAIGVQGASSISFAAGHGFTALSSAGTTNGTGTNQTIDPEYQLVSTIGSYNANGRLGSPAPWESELVTFKANTTTKYAISGVPADATAGTSFNVTVTAQNSSNITDAGYTGTIHFTSSDALAGLPNDYTFTAADAGVHTFSVTLKTAGTQTITGTDTNDGTVTGTSGAVAVAAAAATHYAVSAPASATAGTAFSITVTALDPYGNTAGGYTGTVHLTSSDGAAVLPGDSTLSAGVGTFSVTLDTSGNQTVTATDTVSGTIHGTSGTVAVAAAAATHYALSAPASATAGTAFNITVTALDPYGNTASGYTGTVHFTSSDGAALLPGDSTLSAGVGTFSVSFDTSGSQTVTATDTVSGTITGTSGTVAVAAAAATHYAVGAPASATAGTAFTITVTALDPYGNTAGGYTGTVHFTSSDGAALLPGDSTLSAGVGTFSVTFDTSGSQTVTATDTVSSTIRGTSGTVDIADARIDWTVARIATSAFLGTVAEFTGANPDATSGQFAATIGWGDDTSSADTVTTVPGGGFAADGAHTYVTPATQAVVVTMSDAAGSKFVVGNSGNLQIGGPNTGAVLYTATGAALTGKTVASFTFGNGSQPATDFVATIDWGDGTVSSGTVTAIDGTYRVAGTHTYVEVGDFTTETTVLVGNASLVLFGQALAGGANQQFVMAVYEDVLGHASDPKGLAYWSGQLGQLNQAGAPGTSAFDLVRSHVAEAIAHSAEYYANIVVTPAYERYLGRVPDAAGLAYWTAQMDGATGNITDRQLEAYFAASDEFYADAVTQLQGPADEAWVKAVYQQLLGRAADQAGLNYWLNLLESKEQSGESPEQARQGVAEGVAGGNENITNVIEQDYFHYLGRAADPDGLAYWLQQFADGAADEELIGDLTGSDEYYNVHA